MIFLNKFLAKLFPPVVPLPGGIYSYRPQPDASFPYPMHLRIESADHALLILNASTVLHLNQTAAEFIYQFIQGNSEDATINTLQKRYNISADTLRLDYHDLFERITTLMTMPDLDPVSFLDFDRETPYSSTLGAPYRLDLALTYRFQADESVDSLLEKRVKQELNQEQWMKIIDRSWEIGIPHLIFTGGEPTLCRFLPELIAHAELNGQVTGLLTNGKKLVDAEYRQLLLNKGLDHIMVILDLENEISWQAVESLMPEDIAVTVHLTIHSADRLMYEQTLDRLMELGVQKLSLSAQTPQWNETLNAVNEYAAYLGFSLIWDIPVPYSANNPVSLEMEEEDESAESSPHSWLYIEPDGDVLISQGQTEVLGNMLSTPWDEIWSAAVRND